MATTLLPYKLDPVAAIQIALKLYLPTCGRMLFSSQQMDSFREILVAEEATGWDIVRSASMVTGNSGKLVYRMSELHHLWFCICFSQQKK